MSAPSKSDVLAALEIVRTFVDALPENILLSTIFDFGDGNGPVPAHRHINPDGTVGGWVADTAFVASSAYVGQYAKVYGKAHVCGHARIDECAQVYGSACVFDEAEIRGHTRVFGQAQVCGNARLYGHSEVSNSTRIKSGDHRDHRFW